MIGLTLPGWFCACGVFNGEARTELHECRACGEPKPRPCGACKVWVPCPICHAEEYWRVHVDPGPNREARR